MRIDALLTEGGGISFFPTYYSRRVFTIPCLFIFLRTLLHFFALTRNATRLFSRVSALCVQQHRVVGYPLRLNPTEKPHRKFVVQVVGLSPTSTAVELISCKKPGSFWRKVLFSQRMA